MTDNNVISIKGRDMYKGVPSVADQAAGKAEPEEPQPRVDPLPWPTPTRTAFAGTVGDMVALIDPHTEADPAAVLATLLASVGAACGPDVFMLASNDRHPARVWPLIIGKTSNGAKGTSWSVVRTVLLKALPDFGQHLTSGLSSGEGLVEQVRDGNGDFVDPDAPHFDEGVPDKRLLVVEEEYSQVLNRMRRDGSSLGTVLREAWDGRTMRVANRRKNALCATGAHIVLLGHVTPRELLLKLAGSELAGGSFNRLLPILSRRSKNLPDGGNLPGDVRDAIAADLHAVVETARGRGVHRMLWSTDARKLWHEQYASLLPNLPDGPLADATARARQQVLRLSVAYALFDRADTVDREHLVSALALWEFALASARYVFTPNEDEDEDRAEVEALLEFIRKAGQVGVTGAEVSGFYNRHKSADDIKALLGRLIDAGRITQTREPTRGRPTLRYRAR